MKVAVTITGFIDIPDTWSDPDQEKENPYFPLDVADYHYNEKLVVEDAIDSLAHNLKAYPADFDAAFTFPETHRTTNHPSKPLLESSEKPVATP